MAKLDSFIDSGAWDRMQEQLAKALDKNIRTLDLDGNEFFSAQNNPYCSMICNKSMKKYIDLLKEKEYQSLEIECEDGLKYVLLPLKVKEDIFAALSIGCFKKEETKSIQHAINIASIFTTNIPELIYRLRMHEKRSTALSMIKDITTMINSKLEIKKIMLEIIRFIVENNYAKTCSVVTLNPMKRYTLNDNALPGHYTALETEICSEVIKNMAVRGVANISKDKRFKSTASFNIYDAMVSIPIMNKFEMGGVLNLYDKNMQTLKANIEIFSIIAEQAAIAISNAKQYEEMKTSAITDKLTGLYNRRHFMDVLEQELSRSRRFGHTISVAMIDLDSFKQYNDRNGHPKGDDLLRKISGILKSSIRDIDTVGRYGGEEFIIVFPEIKPSEILSAANRVVEAVANENFDFGEFQPLGKITISMGLMTSIDAMLSPEELIKEADQALYDAKRNGRNKVQAKVSLKLGMRSIDVN